jgi:hypothetical protein
MPSKSETVLQALEAALTGALPAGARLLRNAYLPERIPSAGLTILRDGDPGEPEPLMSPPAWLYEHRAEIDVIVDRASPDARDAAFDALKLAIGLALARDRTLGGVCDYALGEAPAPVDLAIDGAEGMKAATIAVVLAYATEDPLS